MLRANQAFYTRSVSLICWQSFHLRMKYYMQFQCAIFAIRPFNLTQITIFYLSFCIRSFFRQFLCKWNPVDALNTFNAVVKPEETMILVELSQPKSSDAFNQGNKVAQMHLIMSAIHYIHINGFIYQWFPIYYYISYPITNEATILCVCNSFQKHAYKNANHWYNVMYHYFKPHNG